MFLQLLAIVLLEGQTPTTDYFAGDLGVLHRGFPRRLRCEKCAKVDSSLRALEQETRGC